MGINKKCCEFIDLLFVCLFNHQLDRLKTLLPLLITVCVNNPSIYLNSGMAGVRVTAHHCALLTFPCKSLMALSSLVTNSSLLEAGFTREYWVRRPLEKVLALNKGKSLALAPAIMLLCSSFS